MLNEDQKQFLDKYKIPISGVFNATGIPRKNYNKIMKELGKYIAVGVTPCKKLSHTMRTRNGTCIQCSPLAYVFLKRYVNDGEVYIAGSTKGKIIKIGTSKNSSSRIDSLNGWGYAGFKDWEVIISYAISGAGEIEYLTQKLLNNFERPTSYYREDNLINCYETFQCRYNRAHEALLSNIKDKKEPIIYNSDLALHFNKIEEKEGKILRKGNDQAGLGAKPIIRAKPTYNQLNKTVSKREFKADNIKKDLHTYERKETKFPFVKVIIVLVVIYTIYYISN